MTDIKIAGLTVSVDNRYPYLAALAADYLAPPGSPPDITVRVGDGEIEKEADLIPGLPPGYYESVCAYRQIAECLPDYGAVVFHGSVVVLDGVAYAFTAKSGTGKTTHTRLWLSEFPGCFVLNGDKPVLRFIGDRLYACGTPWRGKENYGIPGEYPLGGIAFLRRGAENKAEPLLPEDAVQDLLCQIFMPDTPGAMLGTLALADRILKATRLVRLYCNMEPGAAHTARAALAEDTGSREVEK